jgi:hypothetical protein
LKTLSRNQKIAWQLLKALIAAVSLYLIWIKVNGRTGSGSFPGVFDEALAKPESLPLLGMVSLMMLVNWGIESWKWKRLIQPFCQISFLRSFGAVLSGTTVSLFTPNRIGEFAGRIMHLETGFRIKGIVATITGSMSQLLITLLAGTTALFVSGSHWIPAAQLSRELIYTLAVVIAVVVLVVYFRLPMLARLIGTTGWQRNFAAVSEYNYLRLTEVAVLSCIRYMVFTIQFYLVLKIFGIVLPFMIAVQLIAIIFLVMAVVPTMALLEITVRGSVALYVLAPYTADSMGVLAASTLLWLINLAVPAGMGALSAFWFRINR